MDRSRRTAPSPHGHLCCAALSARDVEYFHDHARIERMYFDRARAPEQGMLNPDASRTGLGLALKSRDLERYRVYENAHSRRSGEAGREFDAQAGLALIKL